jgi:hypothetical protein
MWHTSHVSTPSQVTSSSHVTSKLQALVGFTLAHSNSSETLNSRTSLPSGVHIVQLSTSKVVAHGMSRKVHITTGEFILPRYLCYFSSGLQASAVFSSTHSNSFKCQLPEQDDPSLIKYKGIHLPGITLNCTKHTYLASSHLF